MTTLDSEIKSSLINQGATWVGYADLSELPEEARLGMKNAVSIAVALDAEIINDIANGPNQKYHQEYRRANRFLAELCEQAVSILKKRGHEAIMVEPTVEKLDYDTLATVFAHKTAATRAGLGWIGKSALLITKDYGAAVRLAPVLTDAELQVGTPINHSLCGDCQECRENCPAGAIGGLNWQIGTAREVIFDAYACCETAQKLSRQENISETICGICVHVCPWTQKYLKRG